MSGPNEEKELTQIVLVKLADTPYLEEIDQFRVLIQRQINPDLSDYFINLTGTIEIIIDQHGPYFWDPTIGEKLSRREPNRLILLRE